MMVSWDFYDTTGAGSSLRDGDLLSCTNDVIHGT